MASFEYLVCQAQEGKITGINGRFPGPLSGGAPTLDSCPNVWDYLNLVGEQGWELVGAYNGAFAAGTVEKFILKRARR